jgi:Fe-S-cluster containining protein
MREEGFDFSFDPAACEGCVGYCCTGESGYTWVSQQEISRIADYLGREIDALVSDYLVRIGKQYYIKEVKIEGGFYCLFFDEKKRQCAIYDARPEQCRTFPFWEHFKDKPDEAFRECPGVRKTQV